MHTTSFTSVSSNTQTWPVVSSKSMRRVGYILSSLAVLFLLIDSVMKLLALPIVLETSTQLGYQGTPGLARTLGIILFIFAVLSHFRVESPLLTHTLFGVYLGVFVWGGLLLRDERLRMLFPWRR
jgi:hypothetical protein